MESPTPIPALQGGAVLAAGLARGPDAKPASNPKPLSVKAFFDALKGSLRRASPALDRTENASAVVDC